jgi:hypothetical protein
MEWQQTSVPDRIPFNNFNLYLRFDSTYHFMHVFIIQSYVKIHNLLMQ